MRTPPKIHKFYGEAMDFWSFGEIYPCRSVIVSILILAHFVTASNYYKLMESYTYKLISYSSSFLQSHLRGLFTMKNYYYYFNYLQHRWVQHR